MAGAEWGWTTLSLSVLLNNAHTSLCPSLLVHPSALPSTMGSRTLQGCFEGKGVCDSLVPAPLVTTTLGLLRAPSPFMV